MRHEFACLKTDYDTISNQLTELTYSIFQEIQEHPELFENNPVEIPKKEVQQEQPACEIVKEKAPIQIVENDPLLAAVKAFEEQNALTEEWTTPEVYFGSIRSVQPGSLADTYGILDCDRIIQFGEISVSKFIDLKQFAEYFESSRGKDLNVLFSK